MEKRKPGRPPKTEEVKTEEVVQEEKKEEIEQAPKKEEPKKKSKTGYKVKASFFYKGIQFHPGQDIGYNEQLLSLGKIEKV